jgi:uncharacterized membrane protein
MILSEIIIMIIKVIFSYFGQSNLVIYAFGMIISYFASTIITKILPMIIGIMFIMMMLYVKRNRMKLPWSGNEVDKGKYTIKENSLKDKTTDSTFDVNPLSKEGLKKNVKDIFMLFGME